MHYSDHYIHTKNTNNYEKLNYNNLTTVARLRQAEWTPSSSKKYNYSNETLYYICFKWLNDKDYTHVYSLNTFYINIFW